MAYNNINQTINLSIMDAILANITSIKAQLPFLVNLTKKERKAGKVSQNKLAFTVAAYDYAINNTNLVPAALNIAEWANDITLLEQLTTVLQNINVLQESLKDTTLALRIESQTAAFQFYQYAKIATRSQTPGVDIIVDDLKNKLQ